MKKQVVQYLQNYAEPHIQERPQLRSRAYDFVLVIPVHAELPDCLNDVLPPRVDNTLVIAVVNCAADHAPEIQNRTQAFLQPFGRIDTVITRHPLNSTSDLLVVDCCQPGRRLPAQQGVGLARKIGADVALAYIADHQITCPWIHCTDADVVLPEDYFDLSPVPAEVAVALYPFRHHPPHPNILLYEVSLRYYVAQLAAAQSPYAFQTIGSLMKINAPHYAAVRGFPKRRAAEDFYILNKLAKTGQVLRLKQPVVQLASRISTRVPFGTGAAMHKLHQGKPFPFYDPRVFAGLAQWLQMIDALWEQRASIQTQGLQAWWPQKSNVLLLTTLLQLGFNKPLHQAYRQCRDLPHFRFFLWGWFDAFRTLKFIHGLRDQAYPSLSGLQVFEPSLSNRPTEPSLAALQQINAKLVDQEAQLPNRTGPTLALQG